MQNNLDILNLSRKKITFCLKSVKYIKYMHITQKKMLSSGQVPRTLPSFSLYIPRLWQHNITEAKFIVPDGGDKVDSGIGFSFRPARLHRLALAGRYTTTLCRSQLYRPQKGTMNLAIAHTFHDTHTASKGHFLKRETP